MIDISVHVARAYSKNHAVAGIPYVLEIRLESVVRGAGCRVWGVGCGEEVGFNSSCIFGG